MWRRPLNITLMVKRTRTGWQVVFRVQFNLKGKGGRRKLVSHSKNNIELSEPIPIALWL
ncbi:hypothetical protein DEV91_11259 [Phyllobacterium brassicacearum]|nr:hypothetical protein DEV91_11259 [Phyllobacterium brassicacearum]